MECLASVRGRYSQVAIETKIVSMRAWPGGDGGRLMVVESGRK